MYLWKIIFFEILAVSQCASVSIPVDTGPNRIFEKTLSALIPIISRYDSASSERGHDNGHDRSRRSAHREVALSPELRAPILSISSTHEPAREQACNLPNLRIGDSRTQDEAPLVPPKHSFLLAPNVAMRAVCSIHTSHMTSPGGARVASCPVILRAS